jgi:hypothetical protein
MINRASILTFVGAVKRDLVAAATPPHSIDALAAQFRR